MGSFLTVGEVYRYAKTKDPGPQTVEGLPNFWHVTDTPGGKRAMLESGINGIAPIEAVDGRRRPAVLIRSSHWKFGTVQTPWHDLFHPGGAGLRYYGDHKPEQLQRVGTTKGNAALLAAWGRQLALVGADRRVAEPLLVFSSVPGNGIRKGKQKGQVRFDGVGLITHAERVEQSGPDGRVFPNYAYEISLIPLEDGRLDWSWIADRRDPKSTSEQALSAAPRAWREWIEEGRLAPPRVRRPRPESAESPDAAPRGARAPGSGGDTPVGKPAATTDIDEPSVARGRLITEAEVLVEELFEHLEAITAITDASAAAEHELHDALGLLDYTTSVAAPTTAEPVTRRELLLWQLIRDVALARHVKALHHDKCQVCGLQLQIRSGASSQAAHIRGLGRPHNGPDELANLLCLCPNHHVLFDGLAIYVDPHGTVRRTEDHGTIGPLRRHAHHRIDEAHLAYHRERCLSPA